MMKAGLADTLIKQVTLILRDLIAVSAEHFSQLIFAAVIFLLIMWLIHRLQNHRTSDAIYRNFPFFKEAVDSFQLKIDHILARLEALEEKVGRLESKIQK